MLHIVIHAIVVLMLNTNAKPHPHTCGSVWLKLYRFC